METFEGCPSPFTRLAEGRRSPALLYWLSEFQPAGSLRSAALSLQQEAPSASVPAS